jgi:protein-disulfide isomerase
MSPVEDHESDLTRKQRREQAREQRKALEEASAAEASQRKRLIQLGGVAAVVVVVIAIILVATGGGSKSAPAPASPEAKSAETTVTALLQGIPQSGSTLGNPSAPITIQYFGDLECPICKEFTLGALPPLIEKYVRTGKVKIEYRSMETATRERETFQTQQVAALAAGKQHLMWHYIELFYHEQGEEGTGYVTESYLQGLAAQVSGLNLSDWSAARGEPGHKRRPGRRPEWLHGYPVVLDLQDRRVAGKARKPVAHQPKLLRSGDRKAAEGLREGRVRAR